MSVQQQINRAFDQPTILTKYTELRKVVAAYNELAVANAVSGEPLTPDDVTIEDALKFNK